MKLSELFDYFGCLAGLAVIAVIVDLITTTKDHISTNKEIERKSKATAKSFEEGIDAD